MTQEIQQGIGADDETCAVSNQLSDTAKSDTANEVIRSEFGHEVSETRALMSRYLTVELANRGLDKLAPSHGDLLACLLDAEAVRMSDLARAIGRDPSTATALVKKLVALGYAETHKSLTDGRSTEVSLTPAGRALKDDFVEVSKRLRGTWQTGITTEDLKVATRVLSTMRANLVATLDRVESNKASDN